MHQPTRLIVVAALAQVLSTGAAFGGDASAPIVLLEQDRSLSTMVIVPPCEQPNTEFANDEALDFEPFVSLIESIRSCKDATGVALAQQSSEFGPTVITAAGMVYSSASSEINTVIHAIPGSFFEATFQVETDWAFEVTGSISASGALPVVGSNALVRLMNGEGAVVFESLVMPDGEGNEVVVTVNEAGDLAAGTYTLRANAAAIIDSNVPPSGTGFATFDIEFRIVIPGDLNQDGVIDSSDHAAFCAAIGTSDGDPAFNADADLNGDSVVDELDQALFNEILMPCDGDVASSDTFAPPADGVIDAADLAFLLGAWGSEPSCADFVSTATFAPPPDGEVNGADLAHVLGAWGACK